MIEPATFHVITTELVVGSFALAGLCFVLHSLISIRNKESQFVTMMDSTAHIALLFGLLALPFAIASGIIPRQVEPIHRRFLPTKCCSQLLVGG